MITAAIRAGSRSRRPTSARNADSPSPRQTLSTLIAAPFGPSFSHPLMSEKDKGPCMRIVAGAQRGRALVAPKGHSTRPTADRTRQALFNVLEHAPWGRPLSGARVIDLFAGSGALGLEAMSRGASFCLFVENDGAAREAVVTNLAALGLTERARVLAT